MRKLTIEQIREKLVLLDPNLTLDESTYINTSTKCRLIDEKYGEFWCKIAQILSGKQKGHPQRAKERARATNLERYGVEYPTQSKKIRDKIEQTNLKKYGTKAPAQNKDVQNKMIQTNIKRYGFKCSLQNEQVQEKRQETNRRRYGAENPLQNMDILNKVKQTNLKRYGVESTLESPEVKNKIAQTNLSKYGVTNPFASSAIQEQIKQTMMTKYGQVNPHNIPEIKAKMLESYKKRRPSSGEKELFDWIESLGFRPIKTYIGKHEIDILIKERGIAIEYNGDYWHSEANKNITKRYHYKKTKIAEEHNLQLIHIFESEWKNKKEICKNFLKAKFGLNTKIFARKCEIKEVSIGEANTFFDKYHLQGRARLFIAYGLYYKNELVSCAGFSRPHRQNMDNMPHLSRFVSKEDISVVGGLSKLCNHAYNQLGKFISFVHLRLSSGSSYRKAGFELVKKLPPDYWYFDSNSGKIISKQARKKNKVNTPAGMTEHQHAILEGLFRIYDCGKLKFIYSKQKSQ
ncbi:MAG: hypothetical protein QXL01_02700 [Thermoplasmatales archaeon]